MQSLIYLPKGYKQSKFAKWPFILFLHGAGEKGEDFNLLKSTALPNVLEKTDIPFIVLSPQCPKNTSWSITELDKVLNQAVNEYRIDQDRIYVTGISMGGFATWFLAVSYPYRFAAIAPICGGGNPLSASKIKHLPIWVFHGADDKIVSPNKSKEMVAALRKCGANVRFTLYPDTGHDSWTQTYNNPQLYEWFKQHKRKAY